MVRAMINSNGVARIQIDTSEMDEGSHTIRAYFPETDNYKNSAVFSTLTLNPSVLTPYVITNLSGEGEFIYEAGTPASLGFRVDISTVGNENLELNGTTDINDYYVNNDPDSYIIIYFRTYDEFNEGMGVEDAYKLIIASDDTTSDIITNRGWDSDLVLSTENVVIMITEDSLDIAGDFDTKMEYDGDTLVFDYYIASDNILDSNIVHKIEE